MEEVARYECVYNRGGKDFKDKNKGQLLGQNRAEVLFIGRGSGGQISQHKNFVRSLSNPKPMFSTVLELTTTRFMTKRRSNFACGKISALPRSRCWLLFSLHDACIFDISAHQNVWLRSGSAIVAIIWKQPFLRCLRLFAICDRLRSTAIIWKPAFR